MKIQNICATGKRHKKQGFVCDVSCEMWGTISTNFQVVCIAQGKKGYSYRYSYIGARLMTEVVSKFFEEYENQVLHLKDEDIRKIKKQIWDVWENKVVEHYAAFSQMETKEMNKKTIVRRYLVDCAIALFWDEELYIMKSRNMKFFYIKREEIKDFEGYDILDEKNKEMEEWQYKHMRLNDVDFILICTNSVVTNMSNHFRFSHFLEALYMAKGTEVKMIQSIGGIGMQEDVGAILWRNSSYQNEDKK